jgi:hypothetical protein
MPDNHWTEEKAKANAFFGRQEYLAASRCYDFLYASVFLSRFLKDVTASP